MPEHAVRPRDARACNIRDENLHYDMPHYESRKEWLERAEYLRRHILACCGLWPMPDRTPLNPRIFGRTERAGYAVEKAYFESYPGFFVTGNLYTPLGKTPPFPAVLCPHGHGKCGRLEDSERASVPGRCINFARQGYVVFSYDMVGYVDSFQIGHDFGSEKTDELWGISLAGLQLWNSIRSLDFLQSLDMVDPDRIGCTGASGGGTQTFLLTAVDDRVSAAAPVCMVSAHYQGGCLCENPPGLRVETFNVEIATLAAPRPLLLVSAGGDWTRNTPTCEYPAIREIYSLFGAAEKVSYAFVDAGHNYNRQSREAVYSWFARWLLGKQDANFSREQPFRAESPDRLMVFYGVPLPDTGISADVLRDYLISKAKEHLGNLDPKRQKELARRREILGEIYRHSLQVAQPRSEEVEASTSERTKLDGLTIKRLSMGRRGFGDCVPAFKVEPSRSGSGAATLIVHEKGKGALLDPKKKEVHALVKGIAGLGQTVLLIDCFATGEYLSVEGILERGKNVRHFTTYNRTDTSERVQDILTGIASLKGTVRSSRINLVGLGEAGLWCMLARGLADGVNSTVADLNGFNPDDDQEWVQRLFVPAIKRAGGLNTAIALSAPSKLFMHGCKYGADFAERIYDVMGARANLRTEKGKASETETAEWIG